MDVDAALTRLQAVLRPRVGKKMTAVVMKNVVDLPRALIVQTVQQYLSAYERMPESGTPFPLDVAKAIGDAGCLNLAALHWRVRWGWKDGAALAMTDVEARGVAQHADALLPAYGDDDAEFAVRVAWRCSHHGRLHLVVGRAFNRNDPTPTQLLHDAWQAHGAPDACAPLGVVPAAIGTPGVVYAVGTASSDIVTRYAPHAFVFSPDQGDNIPLDDVEGLQRFFARVPLAITPRTVAWILHLVRIATRAPVDVDDGDLLPDWEAKEEESPSSAASALLGFAPPSLDERAKLTIKAGDQRLTYTRGDLSVASASS